MQIKQRLRINSVLMAATAFFILLVLLAGLVEVRKALKASVIADELIISFFERSIFRSDYLRTGSERAKKQWFAKHEQIAGLLDTASAVFHNPEDQQTIREILKDQAATGKLFSGIVESRESPKPDSASVSLAQEREDRLVTQLEMRLYDKLLMVDTLQESAGKRLYSVSMLAGLGIICILSVLIMASVLNTWSMNRTIIERMRTLDKGVSVIGEGVLEYRIEIEGKDEFSELSEAFNEMSGKLQWSYQVLEREISARRESEQKLKLFIEHAPAAIAMFDRSMHYVAVSRRWLSDYNLGDQDLIGRSHYDIFPEIPDRWREIHRRGLSGEIQVCEEDPFTRLDGSMDWVRWELHPWHDYAGDIGGIIIFSELITERKKAREELRQSREDLDRAQAVGHIGWWRLDTRRNVLTWSPESYRIFGVPGGTPLTYEFFLSTIHPDDRRHVDTQWQAALRGEPYDIEHRIVVDGRVKWVREKAYLEFDKEGELMGGFGITQDITARKQAEEALTESERKYRNLFENMTEEVHFWQLVRGETGNIKTWRLVDANPPALKSWGRKSVEQIKGKTTDEIFGQGATEHYMPIVQKIFAEGVSYSFEDYFPPLDKHFRFTSVPLGDFFITTGADITLIKKAQEALQRSEARWNAAIESFAEGAIIASEDEQLLYWNPSARKMHGFNSPDEGIEPLEKTRFSFQLWTPDGSRMLELDEWPMRRIKRGEKVRDLELRIRRPDQGWEKVFSYSGSMVDTTGGERLIFLSCHDLTELRRTEQALRDNLDRLHLAHEAAHSGTWEWDLQTGKNIWSDELWALFRLDPESMEPSYEAWINSMHPEDRTTVARTLREAVEKGMELNVEWRTDEAGQQVRWLMSRGRPIRDHAGLVTRYIGIVMDITDRKIIEERSKLLAAIVESSEDAIIGKTLDGVITSWNRGAEQIYGYTREEIIGRPISVLAPPELKDEMLDIVRGIRDGSFIEHIETRRVKKDGTPIDVSLSISPILDAEGRITGASTIARDITDRKKLEESLFNLLAELERSNKDLEQFAYVASHDLQEPLRMVSSFTQLLAKRYKDKLDQDAHDYIEYAVNGANRMQRLINDLLSYSRITTRGAAPIAVDMNTALGEALDNLQVSIAQTGALVTNDTLPLVMADYTQLGQVFQNLIGNAVKFHGSNPPRIHISAEKAGNEWKISVKDNGIGIEPQYFDRIFVIFQRLHTADRYQGTGIGLALCKRIVQRFGGNMWVESEPGKGSTFYFTLKGVVS